MSCKAWNLYSLTIYKKAVNTFSITFVYKLGVKVYLIINLFIELC